LVTRLATANARSWTPSSPRLGTAISKRSWRSSIPTSSSASNGRTGAMVATRSQVISVVAFTFAGDRIKGIDLILDPSKLRRIRV
jgi:hypothetical protein